MKKNIPEVTLQRLPVYLNYLRRLPPEVKTVSSAGIASALSLGAVLVRKDLAETSAEGRPKIGYIREELQSALEQDLGCNVIKQAILIGCGGLGTAILGYGGFGNYGIKVTAAFDNDDQKIGTTIAGKTICDIRSLVTNEYCQQAEVAIMTVPASSAQAVCDQLVQAGIKSILSFAPVILHTPDDVVVRHIDVAASLAVLVRLNH